MEIGCQGISDASMKTTEERGSSQGHRGRPRAPRQPGARSTLSLRITAELFDRLDFAAKEKGRPLSNEAELRLETSFRDHDIVQRTMVLAYGDKLAAILLIMGALLKEAGPHWHAATTGKFWGDWLSNPYAFDQAFEAVSRIFEVLHPSGTGNRPEQSRDDSSGKPEKLQGRAWADAVLAAIAGRPGFDGPRRVLEPYSPMLDPIAESVRKFFSQTDQAAAEK